ncbi:MAG TPA: S41 family peptidase [bacterium]|nr:S41 family peptidase [bacterium]
MQDKRRWAIIMAAIILCGALALKVPTFVRAFAGPNEDVVLFLDVLNKVQQSYVEKKSTTELIQGALRGLVDSLDDPYSTYLNATEYREFKAGTSGTFGGVGVVITAKDGYVTVVAPIKGTPGERAGLLPEDRIIKVDGKDVRGLEVDKASQLIVGEPGTEVVLDVERNDEKLSLTITREYIEVDPVETEMLAENLGYIRLTNFNEHAGESLRESLAALEQEGVEGIILDLRGNPGGLLNQALEVAGEFVPAGPVVYVEERGRERKRALNSKLKQARWPLVVLVDGGSASASEIVAGAVQDREAGILVGEKTFGKATVQDVFGLSDGGALKITIGRYLTPTGRSIDQEGIVPDIVVPAAKEFICPRLKLDRVLVPGTGGLDVAELQQRLKMLDFDIPEIDGIFVDKTVDAIKAIQTEQGLESNGKVDLETLTAINERLAAVNEQDLQLEKAVEVLQQQIIKGTNKAA